MNVYLDVDEVVCNFNHGIEKTYPELKNRDTSKYELPDYIDWDKIYNDAFFWLSLPVLDRPTIKIAGYVSHRLFDTRITEFWLHVNRFEPSKVLHVTTSCHKVEVLLSYRCDLYVDDKPQTFLECESAGINTYLYNQPWNQHIKTDKRIYNLKELETLCK